MRGRPSVHCLLLTATLPAPSCLLQICSALVLLPRRLQPESAAQQVAALAALVVACAAPAYLSLRARSWYLPRRAAIMALRLAATWILFPMAVPPAGPAGGMAGNFVDWAKFLAATRSLDHNLMVWLVPLPFKVGGRTGGQVVNKLPGCRHMEWAMPAMRA